MRSCKYIFISFFISSLLNAQVKNGLVASYSFNKGDATDEVGHLDAKVVGASPVRDRFGNSRSAFYLHGNYGSYLNLGTSQLLKPRRATISLWVKIDEIMKKGSGIRVNPIILAKNGPVDDFFEGYFIEYNFDTKRITATTSRDSLAQVTLSSKDTFPQHEWHHIAISYDDHFLSLYLDGINEITMAKNFESVFLEGDSVIIGNTANTKNKRFLNASVDDIQIFNRVLSAKEISELYHAPDPNKYRAFFKWALIITSIILLMGFVVWIVIKRYKKELEKEKQRSRIQARMYELETKAFRSQMNPHFIFNSLCSIQKFIIDQDTESANEYLTRFSKLLRQLLETSISDTLLLKEEISILKNYMDIESLRFDNSFVYEFDSAFSEQSDIRIPFMMVQPFIENAIWHGLLPKSGEQRLNIKFREHDEKRILCIIDDNGVGREQSAVKNNAVKRQSLSINLITQRLELMGKVNKTDYGIKITDKKNERNESLGTRVEILIPKL